jgi:hypothetical protein
VAQHRRAVEALDERGTVIEGGERLDRRVLVVVPARGVAARLGRQIVDPDREEFGAHRAGHRVDHQLGARDQQQPIGAVHLRQHPVVGDRQHVEPVVEVLTGDRLGRQLSVGVQRVRMELRLQPLAIGTERVRRAHGRPSTGRA